MMSWFGKKSSRKSSGIKRKSNKRPTSATRRTSSTTKRPSKICFVKGKPRTAQPKAGSGYFYAKKNIAGNVQKINVTGKTYTKGQALAKMRKIKSNK